MRWYLRCAIDSAKALIPGQIPLRRLKHRVFGHQAQPWHDRETVTQGLQQIAWIGAATVTGAIVLEVGTGWKPTIPILCSLAGATKIYLTDLRPLCSLQSLRGAVDTVRGAKAEILAALTLDSHTFDAAVTWQPSWTFADALAHFRLQYLAPCDCQRLALPTASLDVVLSHAVLEHIPPPIVQGIFRESARLLHPSGVACHIVDNSDHWQHDDRSLSRLNFLRYSDRVFGWTAINGVLYQNRLRHPEYLRFLQDAGFTIARVEGPVDPQARTDAKRLPLDPRFLGFSPDALAVLTTTVLAKM